MHQKCICGYLRLPCKHTKTVLDLPLDVRHRIYIEAGVLINEDIILQRRSPPRYLADPITEEDRDYAFIRSFLQTSRRIRDDILGFLCRYNRIIIPAENVENGLQFLLRLPPEVCAQLRGLYIHLQPLRTAHSHCYEKPLPYGYLTSKQIKAWRAAASHVLRHATPKALSLHLKCDICYEQDKIDALLQPLLDHEGILRDCSLSLSSRKDGQLSRLARDVALRVQGVIHNDVPWEQYNAQPFRFMDLPTELRLRILQFTDLVTPHNEMEWNAERGFSTTHASPLYIYRCQDYDDDAALRRLFPEWSRYCHAKLFRLCSENSQAAIFCNSHQSGYSTCCQCWAPPGPTLMLVSRAMYKLAIWVLYSLNRVIILPSSNGWASEAVGSLKRLREDGSRFFTRHIFPSVALSSLRTIELVFPGLPTDFHGKKLQTLWFDDWRFAVHHLREQHCAVETLTFIVHLRFDFGPSHDLVRLVANRDQFGHYLSKLRFQENTLLRRHAMVLDPLRQLRKAGLRRLFVFLEWDWHWTPPKRSSRRAWLENRGDLVYDQVGKMETVLEKRVMGVDYDSTMEGKMEQYPSQWLENME